MSAKPKYECRLCGKKCKSERGLSTHKTRIHVRKPIQK